MRELFKSVQALHPANAAVAEAVPVNVLRFRVHNPAKAPVFLTPALRFVSARDLTIARALGKPV